MSGAPKACASVVRASASCVLRSRRADAIDAQAATAANKAVSAANSTVAAIHKVAGSPASSMRHLHGASTGVPACRSLLDQGPMAGQGALMTRPDWKLPREAARSGHGRLDAAKATQRRTAVVVSCPWARLWATEGWRRQQSAGRR